MLIQTRQRPVLGVVLLAVLICAATAGEALAQEYREPEGTPLPEYARKIHIDRPVPFIVEKGMRGAPELPNVMITGYWPPTNEMLRRFSPDPVQNPDGWIGGNWEGRGFNVYAFFPEFPEGLGQGEGDFEVDYQDTSADFWPIAEQIRPVAIITFGRASPNRDWEVEWRGRNLPEADWFPDYADPRKPTPSPPDDSVPDSHIRYSTLPMNDIVDAINDSGLNINAFADTTEDAGAFLCEFVGYHAAWYHDLHESAGDPDQVLSAGHIHVGSNIGLPDAIAAAEITVRTLLDNLAPSLAPQAGLIAGPGPAENNPPTVRVFDAESYAAHRYEFDAYGVPKYGVNVSAGDLDGDGLDEILTGAGPGAVFGPHVRGFEAWGASLPGLSVLAYGTNKYGVNVCAGDIDGDGFDEIVTGAGPGTVFGPHVRAWNYDGSPGVAAIPGVSYFAYGTPKWGANVACGDIDGDGFDEIVTGPGPGSVYGPHVRGWNVDNGPAAAMPTVSYFAYGTLKFGVNVCCGDVDGDGMDEIITGAGPGAIFASHIRGWNYDNGSIASLPGFSYFAWPESSCRFGAKVFSGVDLDGDGSDELVVGAGPDPAVESALKLYRYNGSAVTESLSLQPFPAGWTHGSTVAAGRFQD
jgi:pyrrolidone-carboxylate peptidase